MLGTETLGEKTCKYDNHRVLAQLYEPTVGGRNSLYLNLCTKTADPI